jgi:hypothetical protein
MSMGGHMHWGEEKSYTPFMVWILLVESFSSYLVRNDIRFCQNYFVTISAISP